MRIIDSDAHVIETQGTWQFMEGKDAKYRPLMTSSPADPGKAFWIVDGESWGIARLGGRDYEEMSRLSGRDMNAPEEAREMSDVGLRLKHMDELGIDLQVLYPTIFLMNSSEKPAVDIAVCRGYNRWMANIWAQSNNRLLWSMVPPLSSIPDAIDEMRWAKEHGAVGVFMRAVESHRVPHDPYFYPIYEEAQRLNMPITVHISNASREMAAIINQHMNGTANFWLLRLNLVGAFWSLAISQVPKLFPKLRFGFIEATAQWLPLVAADLKRRSPIVGTDSKSNILEANRFYVTCQTDDDLAYITGIVGDDHLVIGTDYGHNDQASEIGALKNLRSGGKISEAQYAKIANTNAAALYGI